MAINAVICELNPMHFGHKHIFDVAKERFGEDSINIAVMSGNFTQRATPAIFDKYTRAAAAVRCGADIVVELPFPWCSSGVENFALGGVAVAAGLGAERLVFGSETGDSTLIVRASEIKDSLEFSNAAVVAEIANREKGSAVIFDELMKSFGIDVTLGANDKLGLEYIRFGKECGIEEFYPTLRIGNIKSATELRQMIFALSLDSCRHHIPEEAYKVFGDATICREDKFNELLFNHCRMYTNNDGGDIIAYASKIAKECASATDFITNLPTKKYTAARIRREILFSILGVNQSKTAPLYTVLLAMNKKGRAYLTERKKNMQMPIITKPSDTDKLDCDALSQYTVHLKADELYTLCSKRPASEFIKKHPHIL